MAGTEPHAWGTDLMDDITFVGLDVHKATVCIAVAEGQLHPSRFGDRQAGNAVAGGNRRAVLCPQSRPRRHAPDLAARAR